jgi:hypothetical protein
MKEKRGLFGPYQDERGQYYLVPLTRNMRAKIDIEDGEHVKQFNWAAAHCPDGRTGEHDKWYAVRKCRNKKIYLHRDINKPCGKEVVDHKDNDGLNCRRYNLVNTTQKHNTTRKKSYYAPEL